MASLTRSLTDPQGRSAAAWARARRAQRLTARFPDLGDMRVLDLGGEVHTWLDVPRRPKEVVLLNVEWQAEIQSERLRGRPEADWMHAVGGDACDPPPEIRERRFDLVFSNSVIEHVGGHARREAFASHARALGDHHWIQTPNRWFPVEPHWLCPGFQYLPPRGRAAVARVWPIGHFAHRRSASPRERLADALGTELLSASELAYYFPEAQILRERIGGLPKSLVAVK